METEETPPCFGDFEKVFPMGADGLRESPEVCLACEKKTECLRLALRGREGIRTAEEKLDHAYVSGHVGFLGRWARKKALVLKKRRISKE